VKRVAVLASGGGSNLQAIVDHLGGLGEAAPAQVVLVASDRPQAGAIDRARVAGIETVVLRDREADSTEIDSLLTDRQIDLVALAGYLRKIPDGVVDRLAGWIVNVHPALLPKFGGPGMYGLRVHQAVLNAGEPISGATVHLVTHDYDSGPIIAQWPVPIFVDDDAHRLAARVLTVEHALYPRVIEALTAGRREVFPIRPPEGYLENPPISPEALERDIIAAFEE
jgi:phosphoribosylglycinamide formyltransferase-1